MWTENYIPPLPELAADKMRTRHEEISTWTAYREELTSWLCLLDDRYSEELQEAIESGVPVAQLSLSKGKAARSTKAYLSKLSLVFSEELTLPSLLSCANVVQPQGT